MSNLLEFIQTKAIHDKTQKINEGLVTFLNPYSYLVARKNYNVFEKIDFIGIDGDWLRRFLKFFGVGSYQRISFDMTSYAPLIFERAVKEKSSIYVIGSTEISIESMIKNIQREFSGLKVVGWHHGYIAGVSDKVIDEIVLLSPKIVIVGMGAPLQEQFLLELWAKGWRGAGFTCGGFIHQTAISTVYYPKWIDKYNLRWLYRIYDEPVLFKRYMFLYPYFVIMFIVDYLKYRVSDK